MNATGENITWYDAAMGGNAVATGNDFSPMVDATVTYWAEDVRVNAGKPKLAENSRTNQVGRTTPTASAGSSLTCMRTFA